MKTAMEEIEDDIFQEVERYVRYLERQLIGSDYYRCECCGRVKYWDEMITDSDLKEEWYCKDCDDFGGY